MMASHASGAARRLSVPEGRNRCDPWWPALLAAVLLHVLPLQLMALRDGVERVSAPPERFEERSPPAVEFVTIPEAPDEEVDPSRAAAEALAARRARDRLSEDLPEASSPARDGESPVKTPVDGTPLPTSPGAQTRPTRSDTAMAVVPREAVPPAARSAETPDPPEREPAPTKTKRRPEPSEDDPRRAETPVAEMERETASEFLLALREKTAPSAPAAPDIDDAETPDDPAAPPPRPETPARRPSPPVVPIGSVARPKGNEPDRNRSTSARLEGDVAYETLEARHPEYMQRLKEAIERALAAQAGMRSRSYRAGVVRLAMGVDPDGTLARLEVTDAREEMLAEKNIGVSAIRAAAPFPPFTEEMLADKDLFSDVGVSIFFH